MGCFLGLVLLGWYISITYLWRRSYKTCLGCSTWIKMQRLWVLPSCTGDILWSQSVHSSDWAPSSHPMHPSAELWAGLHCQSWHSILFLMLWITDWKQTRPLSQVLPDIIEWEEFRMYSAAHNLWSARLLSIFITSQWIHPLNVYLVMREDLFDLETYCLCLHTFVSSL